MEGTASAGNEEKIGPTWLSSQQKKLVEFAKSALYSRKNV